VIALIASRRPDALTRPQFWAEDGAVWYAQAYNDGAWSALLHPWTGYVQTFSRLTAAVSLSVPLVDAPLVFAVAALVAQAVPPLFLLSSRFAGCAGVSGPTCALLLPVAALVLLQRRHRRQL